MAMVDVFREAVTWISRGLDELGARDVPVLVLHGDADDKIPVGGVAFNVVEYPGGYPPLWKNWFIGFT